ncbi:MAG TPA: prepilin peptidase [Spirochaetes bacterium]|nr:prepilin peptidase [Spirochaetota bacterium]
MFVLLFTGAIGFVFIFVLWFFSRGKIGLGDAKLSALIALILGLNGWIAAIFIASASGLVLGLALIKLGKLEKKEAIPFGPFLAFGAILAFLLLEGFNISAIQGFLPFNI